MAKFSETARERELYRYYQPPEPAHHHDPHNGSPPPKSSTDTAITAFAQLGALRLNAARCIISLVGRKAEYVLAEASKTLSLQDDNIHNEGDQLWFGSGALRARSQIGTILIDSMAGEEHQSVSYISVNNLQQDDRFKHITLVTEIPFARSLVCLPLRTARGHVIGLYCMIDDRPRSDPSEEELQFLKDMAFTTMNHIEAGRVRQRHDRAERMVKALALFLEGGESLRGWWLNQASEGHSIQQSEINERSRRGATLEQQADSLLGVQDGPDRFSPPLMMDLQVSYNPAPESSKPSGSLSLLDGVQELAERKSGSISADETTAPSKSPSKHKSLSTVSETSASETQATTVATGGPTHSPSTGTLFFDPETNNLSGKELQEALLSADVKSAFSRASNLIREALQLDGAAFFDASIGSFGAGSTGDGMNPRAPGAHTFSSNTDTGSSGSDRYNSSGREGHFRLSSDSPASVLGFSTQSRSSLKSHANSERLGPFSERLLRVLAKRYPHGKIFNFDEDGSISSSDAESRTGASSEAGKSNLEDETSKTQQPPEIRSRKAKRILSCQAEAAAILKVIPAARSVAWFPLWDSANERWYAGILIWSSSPLRVLTPEDELIYMAAWGNSIMAEVSRLTALVAARMKVDFVSSISHELRSPLHGILASVEFLQEEENMTPMQVDMINTIHSCGKTLLDTIDHVLEFAKVTQKKKSKKSRRRTGKQSDDNSREHTNAHNEEMSDLCKLTEEVMESVYAGRNQTRPSNDSSFLQMAVVVILDISWRPDWNFKINVGAFRRVLMNLFSNAVKYTDAGFVKVAVALDHQRSPHEGKSHPTLHLTVTDSGKGISREFLRDHLYTAFKQEDALSVGTGLGLSIVRRVLRDIDGNVDIESELGSGTKASVSIPLKSGKRHSADSQSSDIVGEVREKLKGRQACIVNEGFDIYPSVSDIATGILSSEAEGLMFVKSSLTSVLTDWLNVEVSLASQLSLDSGYIILTMAFHNIADKIRSLDADITASGHNRIVIVLCAATYRGVDFTADKGTRVLYLRLPVFPHRVAKILHDVLCKHPTASTNTSSDEHTSSTTQKSSDPSAQGVLSILKKPPSRPKLGSRKSSRVQLPERPALPTEDSNETLKPVAPPSTLARNTYKVLLVEDNEINLKLLNMHMTKLQQAHASATNGREAIDAYKASPADIVFMDLHMPVMDGLEASREIRRYEHEKGLVPAAIVALTGAASLSARQEAFSSGMDLFLTKPVAMKVLKEVLLEFRDKGRGALREFG